MEFKDYYATLGVEPSAGDAEIKSAYRRLARKYHPDVSKEAGAEDKFKAVNEAYEALRDPQKRAAYDQLRSRGFRPGDEVPPQGGFGGGHPGFDYEEIFAGGGGHGGFSDFFEQLFGQGRAAGFSSGQGAAARGDSRARLSVPLEKVYNGDSVRVSVGGKSLDVKLPKGIAAGKVIRLKGQGTHGDLLLEIEYAAHPHFEVDGRNLIHVLEVMPWQAALGDVVKVPTLGGAVELKIPAGSEAGKKLRLRSRGLPGTLPGDQIVVLEVLAPVPRTDEQQAAYQALRAAFSG